MTKCLRRMWEVKRLEGNTIRTILNYTSSALPRTGKMAQPHTYQESSQTERQQKYVNHELDQNSLRGDVSYFHCFIEAQRKRTEAHYTLRWNSQWPCNKSQQTSDRVYSTFLHWIACRFRLCLWHVPSSAWRDSRVDSLPVPIFHLVCLIVLFFVYFVVVSKHKYQTLISSLSECLFFQYEILFCPVLFMDVNHSVKTS